MPALILALIALLAAAPAAEAKKRKPAKPKPPRVLVYSGTEGFRHVSIEFGNAVLERLARLTKRYLVTFTEKSEDLTAERLAKTDIVLWNNTTGATAPFTPEQRAAYVKWVSCGGGHMGVHASADSYKDWPEWAELTGAFFKIHPITPTSILDEQASPAHEGWGEPEATILVKDQTSRLTLPWRGLESFLHHDEFYAWDRDPATVMKDFRPLLAFGGFTDPAVAAQWDGQYAAEQPLAWTGSFRGLNRIAYTNLGHSAGTWHDGRYQDSLLEAIRWVGGKRPKAACLRAV